MRHTVALVAGPAAFLAVVVFPAPSALSEPAWHVAGLAAWMATWWLTAVVPLEATALLPILLLPISGVSRLADVTASYADPIIFLFLGGFFLAATLERWDLHKRFALATVRAVGTEAPRVVLAFMLASAAASMWISNTATTVMMLPIAMAVMGGSTEGRKDGRTGGDGGGGGFPCALMLGVAYGASIGGVTTIIGSPPNAIFAAAATKFAHADIGFGGWLMIGVPIALPMLAACWLLLIRIFRVRGSVPGLAETVDRQRDALGRMTGGERFVLSVFALTALAWVLRAPKTIGGIRIPGLTDILPGISDAGIAIGAALLLFATPLPGARFRVALDWESARKVPWGILLLFGGGLALAGAFETSGLTEWVGGVLASMRGTPLPLVLLATTALFVMLTELTSNTATAALGMPLMAGVALALGVSALPLMGAAALAASMAFMLPVATPPNAIVFGSGAIRSADMARAGVGLNLLAVGIITLVVWIWSG